MKAHLYEKDEEGIECEPFEDEDIQEDDCSDVEKHVVIGCGLMIISFSISVFLISLLICYIK